MKKIKEVSNELSWPGLSSDMSFDDVLALLKNERSDSTLRSRAAAFGMALSAMQVPGGNANFEGTRFVLDRLSRAKAEIDIAAWHTRHVWGVTSGILEAAQRFVDDETVAPNEWPLPEDVTMVVFNAVTSCARN